MQKPTTDIVLRLHAALAMPNVGPVGMEELVREAASTILDLRYELAQTKTDLKFARNLKSKTVKNSEFHEQIETLSQEIVEMLSRKNRKYGNSALKPVRIFSKSENTEQIKVRIDDKLSRISSAQDDEDEDVLFDLIGYLMLLLVAKRESA